MNKAEFVKKYSLERFDNIVNKSYAYPDNGISGFISYFLHVELSDNDQVLFVWEFPIEDFREVENEDDYPFHDEKYLRIEEL